MIYRSLVLLHVLAVLAFVLIHGSSIAAVLRIRSERDVSRIRHHLELSRDSVGLLHVSLFLVVVTGVILGFAGGLWGRGWMWAAIGVVIALWVAMGLLGTRYYDRLRAAVGAGQFYGKEPATEEPRASEADIRALARSGRPLFMMGIGVSGLGILTWLMVLKPF
jgi:hypothetical protein